MTNLNRMPSAGIILLTLKFVFENGFYSLKRTWPIVKSDDTKIVQSNSAVDMLNRVAENVL